MNRLKISFFVCCETPLECYERLQDVVFLYTMNIVKSCHFIMWMFKGLFLYVKPPLLHNIRSFIIYTESEDSIFPASLIKQTII